MTLVGRHHPTAPHLPSPPRALLVVAGAGSVLVLALAAVLALLLAFAGPAG
jgi:hypothetical protein